MLRQFTILISILAISYVIEVGFDLPFPASIIGMLILLVLLATKVIKLEKVEKISGILQKDITLFLIPLSVGIIDNVHLFEGKFVQVVFIVIISTILAILVTASVMKLILSRKKQEEN